MSRVRSDRSDEADPVFRLITAAPRQKELSGSFDLIHQYGLQAYYDVFCKRPLPASIAETRYINNLVGDTDIRKGEGMELNQLLKEPTTLNFASRVYPYSLETLSNAFELRESAPIQLSEGDRGLPTISGKVKHGKERDKKHKKHKDKERDKEKDRGLPTISGKVKHGKERDKKHKKHKDKERDKEKDREHKKHKHRHKDKDKEKKKERSGNHENGDDKSTKHHKKKRKHDDTPEDGDSHKHKKRKHKDSKGDDASHMKNGK
eukprot:TRINITY_DN9390_c0_g1_i1.p1 TRINITY_DN9390_c0_g1~~TRINITY_DN9390_c0_g1_i1.p1  ORF type:complete len:262 (-),score=86.10 TRINITY_DN9390_c0_g1_i1:254-1039(-)